MHIEFTQADLSHVDELLELINSQSPSAIKATELKDILNDPDSMILIAEDEDEQVLVACVQLKRRSARSDLELWTIDNSVANNSVEELMMTEAMAFAEFWDCSKLSIKVSSVSTSLKNWCKKNSFQEALYLGEICLEKTL